MNQVSSDQILLNRKADMVNPVQTTTRHDPRLSYVIGEKLATVMRKEVNLEWGLLLAAKGKFKQVCGDQLDETRCWRMRLLEAAARWHQPVLSEESDHVANPRDVHPELKDHAAPGPHEERGQQDHQQKRQHQQEDDQQQKRHDQQKKNEQFVSMAWGHNDL